MATVSLQNCRKGTPGRLDIDIGMFAHKGGQGWIYFSLDGRYCVKIYHTFNAPHTKREVLERIMRLGESLTPDEEEFLCWPLALVHDIDGKSVVGCVTRRVPIPPYRRMDTATYSAREAVEQFRLGRSWGNYLQIARGVARAVAALHGKGCASTDIDYYNFLVDPVTGHAVMLDLDSSVVKGFIPPEVWGKHGFMAPELETGQVAGPSERSDRHSLALLILNTLLFRNVLLPLKCYDPDNQDNDEKIGWGKEAAFSEDPRDRRNRPGMLGEPLFKGGVLSYRMLTPALQKLTERAFINGLRNPDERPSALEWVDALGWALDELGRCSNCHLHFPYPHRNIRPQRRECPFCGERIRDSLPSVFLVYEPRSRGNYSFVGRYLVLSNEGRLFADVLDTQRKTPMSRRNEPIVGHIEWNQQSKRNCLVNDEGVAWQSKLRGTESAININKGNSVVLNPGAIIYFGEGRRLLVVRE